MLYTWHRSLTPPHTPITFYLDIYHSVSWPHLPPLSHAHLLPQMSEDNNIKMWRVCGLLPDVAHSPVSEERSCSGGAPPPPCSLLATLSGHTKGTYTLA